MNDSSGFLGVYCSIVYFKESYGMTLANILPGIFV